MVLQMMFHNFFSFTFEKRPISMESTGKRKILFNRIFFSRNIMGDILRNECCFPIGYFSVSTSFQGIAD